MTDCTARSEWSFRRLSLVEKSGLPTLPTQQLAVDGAPQEYEEK